MKPFRIALASALVFGAVASGVTSPASASLPNNSLLFYRQTGTPNARFATLRNGTYTAKSTSTLLRGWTTGAVSRDTMILYNKNTGKAVTGTFKAGVWTPKNHYTLRKGYDQIVATCDSVIMNGINAQYGEQGTLTGGAYHSSTITPNYGSVIFASSCDSLLVYFRSNGEADAYTFVNGTVADRTVYNFGTGATAIVGTDDSLLVYNGNIGDGAWGTFHNATWTLTGSTNDFSKNVNHIAGTATSLAFYTTGNPVMGVVSLVNGSYIYKGTVSGLAKNWSIVIGAK